MTSSLEVISILKENGWIHVRTTGSHHIFKHPAKTGHVTVPHPRKDLTMKTLKSIERQSGLSLRQLLIGERDCTPLSFFALLR